MATRPTPWLLGLLTLARIAAGAADVKEEARAAREADLRVMSFNIRYGAAADGDDHWDQRKDLLIKTIRAYDPDLLGVQEAMKFQTDALHRALDGYEFVGAGRDDGKEKGEYTGVYFRKSRFEKAAEGHFWLSESPQEPGSKSWDASLTRMASWVRLRDRASAGEPVLLFVNTHFDHLGAAARLESAKLIRKKMQELQPGGAVILVGDFNCTEDDAPYKELVRSDPGEGPTLKDAYRAAHPVRAKEEATYHGFKGTRAGSRIDWVLHTPAFLAASAEIDHTNDNGRHPSDHYPVTSVLRLTR